MQFIATELAKNKVWNKHSNTERLPEVFTETP